MLFSSKVYVFCERNYMEVKMKEKNKENKFISAVTTIGNWIANFFFLHLLWILYSLRGLIIAGLLPSTAAVTHVMYKWFNNKDDNFKIREEFNTAYKEHFKQANQIGYIVLIIFAMLYVDLRVSNVFIQSIFFHTLLLFITFFVLSFSLFLFTVMVRYDFSLKNIFKQAFFVTLSVPIYSIATSVGLLLVVSLMRNYIFLAFFFGISLLLLPVVWFTYTGVLKAEEKRDEEI